VDRPVALHDAERSVAIGIEAGAYAIDGAILYLLGGFVEGKPDCPPALAGTRLTERLLAPIAIDSHHLRRYVSL
jgi:hypothetical protein